MLAGDLRKIKRRDDFQVEFQHGRKAGILAEIRFDMNARGNETKRTVRVLEDGAEKRYDGKYTFSVTAWLVGGKRIDL
jgi:hypothetical protein